MAQDQSLLNAKFSRMQRSISGPKISPVGQGTGVALLIAFIACVPMANWLIGHVGYCHPGGPCTIQVFPGIEAPSGVVVIGIAFVLRDLLQRRLGLGWGAAAIGIGTMVSLLVAPAAIAVASIGSYVVSETVDLLIYTALARQGLFLAVAFSAAASAAVDSALFVALAFGSLAFAPGQLIGKIEAIVVALPLVALFRQMDSHPRAHDAIDNRRISAPTSNPRP
jgi:uncharacterized PurR-regulated membrane protein YhhQ (DUF165 family)